MQREEVRNVFLSRKQAPCLTLDRRVVALLFLDRRSFYPGYSLFSGRGTVPGASQHPDLKITPRRSRANNPACQSARIRRVYDWA